MKKFFSISVVFFIFVLLVGCSHKVNTKINPDNKDYSFSKVYLKKLEGDNKFYVYKSIKDELELLGFKVVVGSEMYPEEKNDVILSYEDKWVWDMTNYLLKLDMELISSINYSQVAKTSIYRTSLIRKNRKYVTREALSELIYRETDKKDQYVNSTVRHNGIGKINKVVLSSDGVNKRYMRIIKEKFNDMGVEYVISDSTYPPKGYQVIASVYTLRTSKYLQFKDFESKELIAEIFLERTNSEKKENKIFNNISSRLGALILLDRNNDFGEAQFILD